MVTKTAAPRSSDKSASQKTKEDDLDNGLRDSFPASDPPAMTTPTVPGAPDERGNEDELYEEEDSSEDEFDEEDEEEEDLDDDEDEDEDDEIEDDDEDDEDDVEEDEED
jgi:hypothetical protein